MEFNKIIEKANKEIGKEVFILIEDEIYELKYGRYIKVLDINNSHTETFKIYVEAAIETMKLDAQSKYMSYYRSTVETLKVLDYGQLIELMSDIDDFNIIKNINNAAHAYLYQMMRKKGEEK